MELNEQSDKKIKSSLENRCKKSPKIPIILSVIIILLFIPLLYDVYFVEHTEFLGGLSITVDFIMMLFGGGLILLIWTIYLIILAIAKKNNDEKKWWIPLLLTLGLVLSPFIIYFIIYLVKISLV